MSAIANQWCFMHLVLQCLHQTSSLDCVLLLFFAWIVVLLAMGFSVVKDDTQVKKACPSPQTIQKRLLKQTPSALLEKKHAYLMRSEPLAVIQQNILINFGSLVRTECTRDKLGCLPSSTHWHTRHKTKESKLAHALAKMICKELRRRESIVLSSDSGRE